MAKHKNCPNCGAPYDPLLDRCPYCGTAYFDLSTIDFDSREPFFLKVKVCGYTITQLVVPNTAEFNSEAEFAEYRGGLGNAVLCSAKTNVRHLTNLGFVGVIRGDEAFRTNICEQKPGVSYQHGGTKK